MARREADLEKFLRELGLLRMAEIIMELLRRCLHEAWSPRRLLRELVEEELAFRRQRALNRRLKRGNLPEGWCLETFPFHLQPGVDRGQINQLAELDFLRTGHNIVFIAGTGRGKTGLACSLLKKALLNGHTGMRQKIQNLLDDLHRSIADRRTKNLLRRLTRLDLLVADEMGHLTINTDQANLFFKLLDDRYEARKSTIITTNLPYDDWGQYLKSPSLTAALLSRLRHRCITIEIAGPDLRSLKVHKE
jgi:DNA replication protein DnaC